jgi:sec-independent protein translocase protein TatA
MCKNNFPTDLKLAVQPTGFNPANSQCRQKIQRPAQRAGGPAGKTRAVDAKKEPRPLIFAALLSVAAGVVSWQKGNFMNVMLAMGFGGWQVILIIAIVLILFGAKKIPELAKGLGTGIKEFKKATREVTDELQNANNDTTPPATPAPKAPANTTAQNKLPETKEV